MTMSNTLKVTSADIAEGDTITWSNWARQTCTARIDFISRGRDGAAQRISTNKPGIYFESTCFHTLDEVLANVRDLKVVKP